MVCIVSLILNVEFSSSVIIEFFKLGKVVKFNCFSKSDGQENVYTSYMDFTIATDFWTFRLTGF